MDIAAENGWRKTGGKALGFCATCQDKKLKMQEINEIMQKMKASLARKRKNELLAWDFCRSRK
ncbi:MAG: hypothetical protein PUJ12_00625 [Oscillospiraceae bacterium]|nr:hypothetical protein [Oscillospiraceae bacterium]